MVSYLSPVVYSLSVGVVGVQCDRGCGSMLMLHSLSNNIPPTPLHMLTLLVRCGVKMSRWGERMGRVEVAILIQGLCSSWERACRSTQPLNGEEKV